MSEVQPGKFHDEAALKGYALNRMCFTLNSAENRAAFTADPDAYCARFGLNEEELAAAYKHYADERIQGSRPRYWQDVTEGEALPVMFKGPMTVTGFIAYAQGWGGLYIRANKLAWKMQSKQSRLPALRLARMWHWPSMSLPATTKSKPSARAASASCVEPV